MAAGSLAVAAPVGRGGKCSGRTDAWLRLRLQWQQPLNTGSLENDSGRRERRETKRKKAVEPNETTRNIKLEPLG